MYTYFSLEWKKKMHKINMLHVPYDNVYLSIYVEEAEMINP